MDKGNLEFAIKLDEMHKESEAKWAKWRAERDREWEKGRKEWEKTSKDFEKTVREFNQCKYDRWKSVADNSDFDYCFEQNVPVGQRNEGTYSDFLVSYLNAVVKNHRDEDLREIYRANPQTEQAVYVDIEVNADGSFVFQRIWTNPLFNDPEKKVEAHYREIFYKMPRKFVSPKTAGVEPLWEFQYYVINHSAEGENNHTRFEPIESIYRNPFWVPKYNAEERAKVKLEQEIQIKE